MKQTESLTSSAPQRKTDHTPAWIEAERWLAGEGLLARPAKGRHPVLEPGEAAGLAAALEEIPSPAFVIWSDGSVAFGNATGRAAMERGTEFVASRLLASLGGSSDAFRITPVLAPGTPKHFIAVQQGEAEDPAPRVAAAVANWGVTPRQAEVLALLALGQPNKTIANTLGCAGATVEIHVSALFKKSGCENRCELVSRFWSGPIGPGGRKLAAMGQQ
jgi:DNA-binding CsgD family transcriptional regulator